MESPYSYDFIETRPNDKPYSYDFLPKQKKQPKKPSLLQRIVAEAKREAPIVSTGLAEIGKRYADAEPYQTPGIAANDLVIEPLKAIGNVLKHGYEAATTGDLPPDYEQMPIAAPAMDLLTVLPIAGAAKRFRPGRAALMAEPEVMPTRVKQLALPANTKARPMGPGQAGAWQRIEEPGRTPSFDKPQGLYLNSSQYETPHTAIKELGGAVARYDLSPQAKVLEVQLDWPAQGLISERGIHQSNAGLEALKKLLPVAERKRLGRLNYQELVTEYQQKYGMNPNVKFLGDKQNVLEAFAGQLAREAGYDAILGTDKIFPDLTELVLLNKSAVGRPVGRGEMVDFPPQATTVSRALNPREMLEQQFSVPLPPRGEPMPIPQSAPGQVASPTMLDRIFGLLKSQAGAAESGKLPGVESGEFWLSRINKKLGGNQKVISAKENILDDWAPEKAWQAGLRTQIGANPYQAQTLTPGKMQHFERQLATEIQKDLKSMAAVAKKHSANFNDVYDDVVLAAKLPQSRDVNVALGEGKSGMTTLDIDTALQGLSAKPYYQEILPFAQKIRDMNNLALEMRGQGGKYALIEPQVVADLRTKWPNHVSLYREKADIGLEDMESFISGIGGGIQVRGTGLHRLKGNESARVVDVYENTVHNLMSAKALTEKNIVFNNLYDLGELNPGAVEVLKVRPLGKNKDGALLWPKAQDIGPDVIVGRRFGKQVYLKVNDQGAANVFAGLNKLPIGPITEAAGKTNNWFKNLFVNWNPAFGPFNKLKDVPDGFFSTAILEKDFGFKGGFKMLKNELTSTKHLAAYHLGKKTPETAMIDLFYKSGATTGGLVGLGSQEGIAFDFAKFKRIQNSNPKQALHYLTSNLEKYNTVFEDSTRYSVFKAAIEMGLPPERAAEIAKNSTLNFNKKGRIGRVANQWYIYLSPGILGAERFTQLAKSPKFLATAGTSIGALATLANMINDMNDPEWRRKGSDWERNHNFVFVLPTSDGSTKRIKIPMGRQLLPMKILSDAAYDGATGKKVKLGRDALSTMWEIYNPAGGSSFMQAAVPTVPGDIALDIYSNKNWKGGDIRPFFKRDLPGSLQVAPWINKKAWGDTAVAISEELSRKGIEVSPHDLQYVMEGGGGAVGKQAGQLLGAGRNLLGGQMPELSELPLVDRLYESMTPQETQEAVGRSYANEQREARDEAMRRSLQELRNQKPQKQIFKYQR